MIAPKSRAIDGSPRPAMVLALALLFISTFLTQADVAPASASGTSGPYFLIIQSSFSGSNPGGPGTINVPLTVEVEYLGSHTASVVTGTPTLPTGFTDTSGTALVINVSPDSVFDLRYNITIASTVTLGSYTGSMLFQWSESTSSAVPSASETDSFAINLLGTVQLSFAAVTTSLVAGGLNNVTLTLTNQGTGIATQIQPTVSSSVGSVLNALSELTSLSGGSSTSLSLGLYLPSSAAGSSVLLTFSTAYHDAYGNSQTKTQTLGLYAGLTAPEPILNFAASNGSLIPGQVTDVDVTLSNFGQVGATTIYTTITPSAGFSVLNQFPIISSLPAGSSVRASLRIFAPTSAAGTSAALTFATTYTDAYGNSRTGSQTLGFYTASTSTATTTTSLSVVAMDVSLTAGEKSPVSFLIINTGQQPVYSPSISLSLAASSPLVVSTNATLSLTGIVIQPGGSVVYGALITSGTLSTAVVTTTSGAAASGTKSTGGYYAGTITISYTDQFGDAHSQIVPVALALTVPVTSLSVTSLSTEVVLGGTSVVSLLISNIGTATLYAPTISFSAPSGLAVTTNSTYSPAGLVIKPGQSIRYDANVTDGPKTTEGAYTGTLTVAYTDQFGNLYSQSFSPGLVVVGQIQMQIQDESVTSANGTVTVSGTLLNEGQGSAYYLQVTASLPTGSKSPASSTEYVGEVDPNTPVPFSLTFAVRAPATSSKSNLTLIADYRNDYSQNFQYKYSAPVTLSSSGAVSLVSGQTSSFSTGNLDLFRYILLAVVVVAIASAAFYVRRSRSRKASRTKSDVI